MGWEIIGVYSDPGVSGSLGLEHRPGLLQAIGTLKRGDVLLVAKRDRLGRLEPWAMAMIEAAVKRQGAKIVSAAGEGTESDDPSSILMRRMVDAFSEYERLIIGSRTKSALQAKKKRGEKISSQAPYGFEVGADGVHLQPCAAEQAVIELARQLRADGLTLQGVAAELNSRGIQRRGGGKWEHSILSRVLRRAA
jgi:DNA invertase Pin-like site-specific DNA recombinase